MTIVWGYLPLVLLCWAGVVCSYLSVKFDRWLLGKRKAGLPEWRKNLGLAIVGFDIFENWLGALFLSLLSLVFLCGMFGAF